MGWYLTNTKVRVGLVKGRLEVKMETEGKWPKGQPSLPPGSVGPKLTEGRRGRGREGERMDGREGDAS